MPDRHFTAGCCAVGVTHGVGRIIQPHLTAFFIHPVSTGSIKYIVPDSAVVSDRFQQRPIGDGPYMATIIADRQPQGGPSDGLYYGYLFATASGQNFDMPGRSEMPRRIGNCARADEIPNGVEAVCLESIDAFFIGYPGYPVALSGAEHGERRVIIADYRRTDESAQVSYLKGVRPVFSIWRTRAVNGMHIDSRNTPGHPENHP